MLKLTAKKAADRRKKALYRKRYNQQADQRRKHALLFKKFTEPAEPAEKEPFPYWDVEPMIAELTEQKRKQEQILYRVF